MATNDRQTSYPIIDRLLEEGYKFNFYQAVRLLEGLQQNFSAPGGEGPPWEEGIRFQPNTSMSFPAADVQKVEHVELPELDEKIFLMTVNFMGLYGVSAPTPVYFSEMICTADSDEDPLRSFLDIFNHRLISLFYRAWKKYRYHITFLADAGDPISGYLLSVCGLGIKTLRKTTELPVTNLIRYTGIISQRPPSAAALGGFLADYFEDIPVRVEQFILRWIRISEEYQNRLGKGTGNSKLGIDLYAGEWLKDRSGKFRIALGPLGLEQFENFLPGGAQFEILRQLTSLYAPDLLEFDIKLILKGEEIPNLWLAATGTARLGYSSWLISRQRDDATIVFDADSRAQGMDNQVDPAGGQEKAVA